MIIMLKFARGKSNQKRARGKKQKISEEVQSRNQAGLRRFVTPNGVEPRKFNFRAGTAVHIFIQALTANSAKAMYESFFASTVAVDASAVGRGTADPIQIPAMLLE